METLDVTEVQTPRGRAAVFATRQGTTDLATVGATFRLWGNLVDEYAFATRQVGGLMVDVGAHIGTASIAVLLDNPGARAIAVEPLPENVAMIRDNAARNGVSDRLTVIEAAVGDGAPLAIRYGPDVHRYIGDIRGADGETITVATVTLADLLADGDIDLLKTDCEGGEWDLFGRASTEDLARVTEIVGEYHTQGPEHLAALLSETHDVVSVPAGDGTGSFRAVAR